MWVLVSMFLTKTIYMYIFSSTHFFFFFFFCNFYSSKKKLCILHGHVFVM